MTARPTRIALVGCGFFGRYQGRAWQRLADRGAELVAICDTDIAAARRLADQLGVRAVFSSMDELLAGSDAELIDIATRPESHSALVLKALGQGRAVIVQKPMAPHFTECLAMVAEADRRGLFFAVHENFRHQRPIRRLKQIVESGEIGEVSWARLGVRTGINVYINQPYFYDEERLVIADLGIHVLDIARCLLGEVAHLSCEVQRRNPKVRAEDTATMLLRHTSGAVSLCEATYEDRRSETTAELLVELEASHGGAQLGLDGRLRVWSRGEEREEAIEVPDADPFSLRYTIDSVETTCASILDAYRQGAPAETSARDNLRTLALVDAAYRAAQGRQVVSIERE